MNKKITKPVHSVIEHDEYFYRHPEMYRTNLDDELSDADEFDPNDDNGKKCIAQLSYAIHFLVK